MRIKREEREERGGGEEGGREGRKEGGREGGGREQGIFAGCLVQLTVTHIHEHYSTPQGLTNGLKGKD